MTEPVDLSLEEMAAELERRGWTQKTSAIWRAPNGSLFLGPAGAWRRMKRTPRDADAEREAIIKRAMRLRVEIEQIFTDCASWNDNAIHRHEGPIDCDPDGKLRRMADGLDKMLATEAAGL